MFNGIVERKENGKFSFADPDGYSLREKSLS